MPIDINNIFERPPDLNSQSSKGMPADYKGAWASWYFPNKRDYKGGVAVELKPDGICTITLWTKAEYLVERMEYSEENAKRAWAWFMEQT